MLVTIVLRMIHTDNCCHIENDIIINIVSKTTLANYYYHSGKRSLLIELCKGHTDRCCYIGYLTVNTLTTAQGRFKILSYLERLILIKKNLNQCWLPAYWKKSKTHKRFNRTLFNQTKQDRMQIFEGILFFKATNNSSVTSFWKNPTGSSEVICLLLNFS